MKRQDESNPLETSTRERRRMSCVAAKPLLVVVAVLAVLAIRTGNALAHCDGLDGPVVKAAQKALETGNIDAVLIWVQKQDESSIRQAFNRTLAVRKLGPEARNLADTYFFETVVRFHRAGEGEPFTGLKPAGRDLGPAIPAADKALESDAAEPVVQLLTERVQNGIRERFKEASEKKEFQRSDVEAGRGFVKAYVEFIHYVEGLYQVSGHAAEGHHRD